MKDEIRAYTPIVKFSFEGLGVGSAHTAIPGRRCGSIRSSPFARTSRSSTSYLCRGDDGTGRPLGSNGGPGACAAKAGSAKGVLPITIEYEIGSANVVVWLTLFEKSRRVVLGSSIREINGRIQREGEVVHLVAQQLLELTGDLYGLTDRDETFRLPNGRGDESVGEAAPHCAWPDRSKKVRINFQMRRWLQCRLITGTP